LASFWGFLRLLCNCGKGAILFQKRKTWLNSLEEFLSFLDGNPVSQAPEINDIVKKIQFLPLSQVALIGKAVADRFAASAEAAGE